MSTKKSHKTTLTNEEKLAAIAEVDAGAKAKDVAARMGVTTSGLYYWRKTLRKKGGALVVVSTPRTTTKGAIVAAGANPHATRDAIVFLRKAKGELMAGIRNGTVDDLDNTHLLSLLALRSLQGGG
jgi:transposase-like protein